MKAQGTLGRLKDQLLDAIFQDRDVARKGSKFLWYLVRLGTHVGRGVIQDQCLQRAAALAYTTILSIVPICALFVIYFKMAGKLDSFSVNIQGWVLDSLVAESAQGVSVYIDEFVANLHTRVLGTIGIGGMIFVAYSTLRTVEHSLNAIWKVHKGRSFWGRFQMLSTLLVIVPTFVFASIYLTGRASELKLFDRYNEITGAMRTLFWAVPLLLTTIPFFILYKLVPNTTVRWRPALIAALVAAVLFETAKGGFNLYVLKVVAISKIYGSLGLLPVFLLWIYFSWIIILFGVELSQTIQNFRAIHRRAVNERDPRKLDLFVHEDWGWQIFKALMKRFRSGGGPVSPDALADDLPLPQSQIEDHLLVMKRSGALVWVEDDTHRGYLPAKPVEQLDESTIVNLFRRQLGLPARN